MNFGGVVKLGSVSVVIRVGLYSSVDGTGLTGLTSGTANLIISTIADNEATAVTDLTATIETISTLGTFATPTSGYTRFKEVDATNQPGIYEIQLENARWAVSSAVTLNLSISGAANLLDQSYLFILDTITLSEIGTQVNTTLGSYGVQTKTEAELRTMLTADYATDAATDAIISDLLEFADGTTKIQVNVMQINSGTVYGAGTAMDKWRGSA